MEDLIRSIIRVQSEKGLNDIRLAGRLGIDAGAWSKIKNGKAAPGAKFLGALIREFPELTLDIMRYLSSREPRPSQK